MKALQSGEQDIVIIAVSNTFALVPIQSTGGCYPLR